MIPLFAFGYPCNSPFSTHIATGGFCFHLLFGHDTVRPPTHRLFEGIN